VRAVQKVLPGAPVLVTAEGRFVAQVCNAWVVARGSSDWGAWGLPVAVAHSFAAQQVRDEAH